MSFTALEGPILPVGGMRRSSNLAEALQARGDHLVDHFTPVVGGVSPGSYIKTQSGPYVTVARPLLPPLDCKVNLIIYCDRVGTATGTIKWTVGAANDTASLGAGAWVTLGPLTASGSAEQTTIEVRRDTGGVGDWIVVDAGIIRAEADSTGLTVALPEAGLCAKGEPYTADLIRRLGASVTDLCQVRKPALQWFTAKQPRTGSLTHTLNQVFKPGRFLESRLLAKSQAPSDWDVVLAFTAANTTYAQILSEGSGTLSQVGAGVGAIATLSCPVRDLKAFGFFDSATWGSAAPVEAFVLYEAP